MFKDPIKVQKGKSIKSPWNYDCPTYDERSSCYVNAGSHYGVGKTQPVGHRGPATYSDAILPRTAMTDKEDEGNRKNKKLEIRE